MFNACFIKIMPCIDLPANMFLASLTISALVFRWKLIFEDTVDDECVILLWLACFPTNGGAFGAGKCLLLLLLGMLLQRPNVESVTIFGWK